jgi:hypothetical protein
LRRRRKMRWKRRGRRRRRGRGGGEEEEEQEKEGISRELWWLVFTFTSMTQKIRQFYSLMQVVQNTVILLEYRDSRNFGFLNLSGINSI